MDHDFLATVNVLDKFTRAKLLRISKLSFLMAYFSPFLLCKRLHLILCELHEKNIKSAHFPKKYGKCADFMFC